jgi:hypothetical protein
MGLYFRFQLLFYTFLFFDHNPGNLCATKRQQAREHAGRERAKNFRIVTTLGAGADWQVDQRGKCLGSMPYLAEMMPVLTCCVQARLSALYLRL